MKRTFVVNGIELPYTAPVTDAYELARKRLRAASVRLSSPVFRPYRRSIDARRRDAIQFVWSIAAEGECPADVTVCARDVFERTDTDPTVEYGTETLSSRPVVVGSGPAGMFCSLLLAENGYRPILIERGGDIASRRAAVERFRTTRVLDTDCNIQFGAGGAGTFSDGKLVTRINDAYTAYVIRRFVEFGAPDEILYMARPHIGTDYLQTIVEHILDRIVSLGGDVRYHTRLDDLTVKDGAVSKIHLSDATELDAGVLVLALGHSARDTQRMLLRHQFPIAAKPFSVGVRVEHRAEDIDRALFGASAGDPLLGHAEYNLSADTDTRGVYTFCMCPGGEVVPAASMEGGVVVNGMSRHARAGTNSNAAVAVSVFKEDYGATPEGAIAYQEAIERAAYAAGGGDYSAPACTIGDFMNRKIEHTPSRVLPTYMDGGIRLALPDSYLPENVCASLERGLRAFGRRIAGYDDADAVLTGAETRTSSPVRLLRSDARTALGFDNVYPCGEGAGYAGGISSAAVDGIRTALAIMARFAPADRL